MAVGRSTVDQTGSLITNPPLVIMQFWSVPQCAANQNRMITKLNRRNRINRVSRPGMLRH